MHGPEIIKKRWVFHANIGASPSQVDLFLLLAAFVSTVAVPDVFVSSELHIGMEELLVPLMAFRLLWNRVFIWDVWIAALIFLWLVIGASILVNHQQHEVRNLFELYKVIKLGILYTFAFFVLTRNHYREVLYRCLAALTVLLAVINFLHLFNAFGINQWLIALYDYDGRDIAFFGLNSLGQPDARRIIGTMGNPNDNAILLLFLVVCFLYRSVFLTNHGKRSFFNNLLLFLSSLLIVLCQSRTGIAVLVMVLTFGLYSARWGWKKVLVFLASLAVSIALVNYMVDHHALTYVTNTHLRMEENNSFNARWEVWKEMIGQWKSAPILGYGPNKEYIYAHALHPENEYIFYLWRYGLLGLAAYCALLFGFIVYFRKQLRQYLLLILLTMVLAFTALTNNPLTNPKFVVIFAIGWAWAVSKEKHTVVST